MAWDGLSAGEQRRNLRMWRRAYHCFLSLMPDVSGMEPLSAWFAFADGHQGRCAICLRRGDQVLDHDHYTGLVRGLICRGCNVRARSGVAHQPVGHGRLAIYDIYAQYPPAAAARYRSIYVESTDPAPHLWKAIWHATSDGLRREADRGLFENHAAAKIGL